MRRTSLAASTIGLSLCLAAPLACQSETGQSGDHQYRIVTVVEDLDHPWSFTWLPNGDMLITERPGRLRIVRGGQLLPDPVPGVPEVRARGQGGLLDVALHPDFATNGLVYLSFSRPDQDGSPHTTAVVRGRFENDRLEDVEQIFVADSEGRNHYGSRLAFDRDGFLFITVGDRQASPSGDLAAHAAQDLSNHHGTVIRLNDDGSVPSDNPFVDTPGARPEIWSYGHRNAQGLAIDQVTGDVWITEHGPQGGDELNLILPGRNYGWPVIGYGVNYSGTRIHEDTHREGMEQPVHYWVPSIATSGLLLYTGDRFPGWRGDLFAGGLRGAQLARLTLAGREVTSEDTLVKNRGRIRDVRQGPDGYIYVAFDEGDGDIVRLEPVDEG